MAENTAERLREDVAHRVMRWTAASIPWAYSDSAMCWHDAEGSALVTCHAWRPDEDERQCMRVLERMLALGYDFALTIEGGRACARFGRAGRYREPCSAESRRVAVLCAALDAVGAADE